MEQFINEIPNIPTYANTLQYLVRKADKPYFITTTTSLPSAVLVLTQVIVTGSFNTSSTTLEAKIYDTIETATTKPHNFLGRYEYTFRKENATIAYYFASNELASFVTLPLSVNAESLNFEYNGTKYKFFEYDNEYRLGIKLTDFTIQALLSMPSLVGSSTLGTEWALPA